MLQKGQEPVLKRKEVRHTSSFNKDGTYLFEEVVEAGVNFLRDRIKRRPPYRFHVERWRRMI